MSVRELLGLSGEYAKALQSSVRDNASAFGYSLAVTVSFGVCSDGSTASGVGADLLFLGGACLAFVAVVAAASSGFRRRVRGEAPGIELLASAINAAAVLAAAGTAALATLLPGVWVWPTGGFGATAAYLLVGALDIVLAKRVAAATDADA